MAMYVKTRNAEQCRTHHQKMVMGYGSIDQIIERIKSHKYSKHDQNTTKIEFPGILSNSLFAKINNEKIDEPLVMTNINVKNE